MSDSKDKARNFHGRLEVAVRSILSPTGYGRTENQDNYLLIDSQGKARFLLDERQTFRQVEGWPKGHMRLAVLDGMGGHSHGREAAENTVLGLLEIPAASTIEPLARDLEALHVRLHREMHRPGQEPGCTLTLLEIPPSGPALLFHAGDSRLYAIDAGGPVCLTVDHVPATQLAMQGLIDEEEWMERVYAEFHSQLCQAFVLGNTFASSGLLELDPGLFELHDDNLPPFLKGLGDRRPIELEPGRVYLLASDGLWHLSSPLDFILRWPEILVRPDQPLPALLDALFQALTEASHQEQYLAGDNCTAIAFRVQR